jgi:Cd2+/Zn2+-exporting ATPase
MTHHELILEGLTCAGCAAKIEQAAKEKEGVSDASLNFSTQRLYIDSETEQERLRAEIQDLVNSIEDGITVLSPAAANSRLLPENAEEEESGRRSRRSRRSNRNSEEHYIKMTLLAGVAMGVLAMSVAQAQPLFSALLFGLGILFAGWKVLSRGVKSIVKFRFTENALMTIAIVAAFAIGEFFEALMVVVLFSIGELLEDYAVNKSRRDIEKLSEIRPDTALVLRGGEKISVPAESVGIGESIVINPHERIPLDCKVTEGQSDVDSSALTGESMPYDVSAGSELLSGMMNGDGTLTAVTTKLASDSAASRIIALVSDSAARKGKAEGFVSKFARIYTPIVVILAVLIAAVPPLLSLLPWSESLMRSLTFLVASCPCAIVISVPLAFFSAIGGAAKLGVLVKGSKFVEIIAKADAAAFDKTGTITKGKPSVTDVSVFGGATEQEVLSLAAAAEGSSSHPIAFAIEEKAEELGVDVPPAVNVKERGGFGVECEIEGEYVLCGSKALLEQAGVDCTDATEGQSVFVSRAGRLIGTITVLDTIAPQSAAAVRELKALGVNDIKMLTGDNSGIAQRVAREAGIDSFAASLLPEDKVTEIEKMKSSGKTVLFAGDGINDAPVLAAADCGIAMGLGSAAAIEAADTVLSAGNIGVLPAAVSHSRRAMRTVKGNIAFAIAVKAAVLILAALGLAPMWAAVFADVGVTLIAVAIASSLRFPRRGVSR